AFGSFGLATFARRILLSQVGRLPRESGTPAARELFLLRRLISLDNFPHLLREPLHQCSFPALVMRLPDQMTPFVLKITHKIARGLVVGQDGAGQRQKCFLKNRHAEGLYHSYLKDKASHDESGESTI